MRSTWCKAAGLCTGDSKAAAGAKHLGYAQGITATRQQQSSSTWCAAEAAGLCTGKSKTAAEQQQQQQPLVYGSLAVHRQLQQSKAAAAAAPGEEQLLWGQVLCMSPGEGAAGLHYNASSKACLWAELQVQAAGCLLGRHPMAAPGGLVCTEYSKAAAQQQHQHQQQHLVRSSWAVHRGQQGSGSSSSSKTSRALHCKAAAAAAGAEQLGCV